MKKILIGATIAGLAIAVLVMGLKLRSLSPPEDYEYSFRTDIDADYHDLRALKDYYATGYAAGSFAREMWHSHGINVRIADADDATARNAVAHYNGLKAYADSLGARLARSLKLKAEGLGNFEIRAMETGELSADEARLHVHYGATALGRGDRSPGVLQLQNQLLTLGYAIPTDGFFWMETEAALRDWQGKSQLPATGQADAATLRALLKSAPIKTH